MKLTDTVFCDLCAVFVSFVVKIGQNKLDNALCFRKLGIFRRPVFGKDKIFCLCRMIRHSTVEIYNESNERKT